MISIIIPIYNSERYLDKCIESILHQTFSNLELILINDGSTDSSNSICERYATLDKRVKLYNTTNRGVCSARNLGIDKAKGEYIAFYDSDDFLKDKDVLEKLYNQAKRYNVDIVKSDYMTYDNSGYWSYPKQVQLELAERKLSPVEFITSFISKESFLWLLLIKREIIADIRFVEGRRYLEDMEFLYQLVQRMTFAVYIPIRHYVYRKHPEAISYKVDQKKISDILGVMYSFFNYAKNDDVELKKCFLIKASQLYISSLRMIAVGGFFSQREIIVKELDIEMYKHYVVNELLSNRMRISLYHRMSPQVAIILLNCSNTLKRFFYYLSYRIKRLFGIYK